MNRKRIAAVATGLAVVGLPLISAAAAHAEEAPSSPDTAQTSPATDQSSTTPDQGAQASSTTPASTSGSPSSGSDGTAATGTPESSSGSKSASGTETTGTPTQSPGETPTPPSSGSDATGATDPGTPPTFKTYTVAQDWYGAAPDTADNPWAVPQTTTVLTCGGVVQHDVYTITSQSMADDYAALLKGGKLTGPADDAEFSPHDYTVTALAACLIPVTVVPVTSTAPTCDTGETYTVPALPEGLKYTDGTVPGNDPKYVRQAPGTYPLAAGQTVTIQEHSTAGYVPVSETFTITGADAIAADSASCSPKPLDEVTVTTTRGVPDCTTQTVVITTTTSTSSYSDVDDVWTIGEPVDVVTHDTARATMVECPLPVIEHHSHGTPSGHKAVAAKPVALTAAATHTVAQKGPLAFTGSQDAKAGIIGGSALLGLGGLLTFLARRRRA